MDRLTLETRLREAAEHVFGTDAGHVVLGGKLLRPVFALRGSLSDPARAPSDPMLASALAIQLAHEASLLHDDVVDGAPIRRDRPTSPAREGTAAALIAGDRLLTMAYRAASSTGNPAFFEGFCAAVDRTVAGEARQGSLRGRVLGLDAYRSVIEDKSGALFGIALASELLLAHPDSPADGPPDRTGSGARHPAVDTAVGATLDTVDDEADVGEGGDVGEEGDDRAAAHRRTIDSAHRLGLRIGALYQMVDDLLDYCPAADRGKPALNDFRQQKWTLPLAEIGHATPFDLSPREVLDRLVGDSRRSPEERPIRRALRIIEDEADAVVEALETRVQTPGVLIDEIRGWLDTARSGIAKQEERAAADRPSDSVETSPSAHVAGSSDGSGGGTTPGASASIPDLVRARALRLGGPDDWSDFFAHHSRSFHFSARLFAGDFRARITGIYAFCRFTDDLVDQAEATGPGRMEPVRERLHAWRGLVEGAHDGAHTGIPLLDRVVRTAGHRGIPFTYFDHLLQGVEMDLDPPEYPDLTALRVYTYRVASVVGGWITEELGVRNPGILDRAFALGHAMQMTNILRDVGEDLRAGRLYLPLDRMAAHGLLRSDLEAAARGRGPVPGGYADLLEELMGYANGQYRLAGTGLHALPFRARAAVAVASRVYRGIHDEIRKNDYDSLTARAHTSRGSKLRLALGALVGVLPRASWRTPTSGNGTGSDAVAGSPGHSFARNVRPALGAPLARSPGASDTESHIYSLPTEIRGEQR